jgi:mono/diheme cytochrome c family protein
MTPSRHARTGRTLPLLLAATALAAPARAADETAGVEFFESKVRPVLAQHCYGCHSARAKKLRGGLRLDGRAAMLKGGDSGPALVPGRPDQSRLVEAVAYTNVELQMPPKARLPEAAVKDLASWVKMGAPWPSEGAAATAPVKRAFDLQQRKREHWAWRPVRPQAPPAVKDGAWPRGPVDRFLLARLEEKGLTPAADTDRRTLLRRLSFDLLGLPPTPAEVEAFVHDPAPDAVEKVVDRLLASPRFGERWGRHWLDLARYAESRGHEFDYTAPNAHHYRDWVIRALNLDLPYDQFVTEQIAGDLLPRPRRHPTEGFNESVLGTGFWFLGEELHSPVDVRQDQADRFDNMVDVFGKTFLGLTVACARCHDHKFDAISTKDYYALFGFLRSSNYRLVRFDTMEQNRRAALELKQLREEARAPVQRALAEALRPGVSHTAEHLLAAREMMLSGGGRLEEITRGRKLDADVLRRWVAHLTTAREDERDPLHGWAKGDASRKREAEADVRGAEVIVDYGRCAPSAWLTDGVAFGTGPVRPGDVRLEGSADRPSVRFIDRGAAEKDPAWDGLRPAPGSQNEPGALGGVTRAGRMLRTPNFTVNAGKVYYLVKGSGQAYASVATHSLIAGPLHGKLILPINAGPRFRWVAHDLSVYKGYPAHVQFTAGKGEFAVAMVVQADKAPADLDQPDPKLLRLAADNPLSAEDLARAYQRLLLDVLARLEDDHLIGKPSAADQASLVNWLLRHTALFAADDKAVSRRVAEAARPFLARQSALLSRTKPESRLAMAMMDGDGADERVFVRGSHKALGEVVPRRFLEALAGPRRIAAPRGSGRLELARQMTDPALNPFVARVLVNRVWHHLFGRGIVASVDNFGVMGERPTHPELLDYLAERFVRDGWSVKRLVRTLVLSRAYAMSSTAGGPGDAADPENLLLHRARLRRLEGEAIRDAMLAVSGRIDGRIYGPPVPVHLTAFQEGRGRPAGGPLDGDGRRSVYLSVRRNFLSPFLLAFDTPSPFSTVGRRTVSNVPAQALILMNDPFVQQQADLWARRTLAQPGGERERITRMYQSAFARAPTEDELTACRGFLHGQRDRAAWADLAHVLFNAKEFIFLQ